MQRNDFIKKLGLGITGLVMPATGLARVKNEPIRIYDNFVRGIFAYGFNDVKHQLKEGDKLELRRESENIYDTFAIAIFWNGVKLGYVAAYENIALANMLDAGVELNTYISRLDLKTSPVNALSMVVFAQMVVSLPTVYAPQKQQITADEMVDLYRGVRDANEVFIPKKY
ncbi:MAG: HIRAN domain-containing protein [Flavobacteriales bacterium]|nr:HIRAN domain-containing protein [Flavobacteriales bacterium]